MKKVYVAPVAKGANSSLRTSILAGSNSSNQPFTPGNIVRSFSANARKSSDVQFARKRGSFDEF